MLLELIGLDKHCSHTEGTGRQEREDVSAKDSLNFSIKDREREREENNACVTFFSWLKDAWVDSGGRGGGTGRFFVFH